MNEPEKIDGIQLIDQISKVCREFRKQISLGKSPTIEDYLFKFPKSGREIMFTNLLEIEINFRQRKGDTPKSEEYLKRFPGFSKQVRQAFFERSMEAVDSTADSRLDLLKAQLARVAESLTQTFDLGGASRLGEYELIRELGRGGMGVVYEARHTKTGNRVALKTLPTGHDGQDQNADRLHRFRKEFRSLSEINHPNLVGMQTLEVDGSQWFFTMDLIEGEDFLTYV